MEDDQLRRIESKLDDTNKHLSAIDVTLASQAKDIEHHVKRTDLLEQQIKPVQEHVSELKGLVKVLKILALIATIIEGFHYLK